MLQGTDHPPGKEGMKEKGSLIILSGFSGVGKGTVLKEMMARHEGYALSVSATTRQPRPGEEEGVSYFFMTNEEFEEMIRTDRLLEYAGYVGHYYGTPRDYVTKQMEAGKDVILEIEIQGALKVKRKMPEAVLIYMLPPDARTLKERLTGRGTESPEVVEGRMKRAIQESEGIEQYDYVLVNDDVTACAERLHTLIRMQHLRTSQNLGRIEEIRKELRS